MHWANRDQYYIKSAAYHPAVAFKVQGKRFQLQIAEARDIPRDNNKDAGRFLFPQIAKAAPDHNGDIVIPCVFRAPDKKEQERLTEIANGENGNGSKIQRGILAEALNQLKEAAENNPALRPLLTANAGGEESAFMRHARRFIRRNTADFFIHRNLRKFLAEELDLYLKSEVINAEELAGLSGFAIAARVVAFRAIRELGEDIIDALAEWENLQKNLWEKKKIILSTEYCIAVGRIPNAEESGILDDIAECDTQWTEWEKLGINCGKKRKDYLRQNPSLPIDTTNFPPEFKDRLLAQFADIDDATDGILIHGENWQALNLIRGMYRGRVKCVYIDPPYNTGPSEILYKNEYKHSSWLCLMENRIVASLPMLGDSGVYVAAIDENEQEHLGMLLSALFPEKQKTCVTVVHNPSGQQSDNFSLCHENAYFMYPRGGRFIGMQTRDMDDADVRPLRDVSTGSHLREDAANCFYPIFVKGDEIIGFGDVCDDEFHPDGANVKREDGIIEVYPIDAKGVERKWVFARQNVEKITGELTAQYNKSRRIWDVIRTKTVFNYKTVWSDKKYSANSYGAKLLGNMGIADFDFPKSVYTVMDCIAASLCDEKSGQVVDYFAGSGTTAHAVMNLNRADGGRRKFILAEAGEHFNTVILPRIKKVIHSPEWKDGKPSRRATAEEIERGPRLVKYQRIESYEDTLENIRFESDGLDLEKIMPRYELEWESRKNPARIVESGLENPFSYTLELAVENGENGQEARKATADLPETFAYLIGLRVRTRRVVKDGRGARYLVQRGKWEGRDTAVIWRDTTGWNEEGFEGDRKFIQEELAAGAERILVNGSACGQGMESLNPIFAKKMFPEGEGE